MVAIFPPTAHASWLCFSRGSYCACLLALRLMWLLLRMRWAKGISPHLFLPRPLTWQNSGSLRGECKTVFPAHWGPQRWWLPTQPPVAWPRVSYCIKVGGRSWREGLPFGKRRAGASRRGLRPGRRQGLAWGMGRERDGIDGLKTLPASGKALLLLPPGLCCIF